MLLKLLDYGVFIFLFTILTTIAIVVYVELYHGSSFLIICFVSVAIFVTVVTLGWLLPAFGDANYWDAQYTAGGQNEVVEWFGISYLDVRTVIRRIMAPSKLEPILHVGCGNSTWPSDLWDAGYIHVTSIDISTVALQHMSKRYARKKELQWLPVDCTNMSFDDDSFQCVMDKGTFDAVLCTNDPEGLVKAYLGEVYRVLRPGGTFMLVTGYEPKDLIPRFQKHPWRVEHNVVNGFAA